MDEKPLKGTINELFQAQTPLIYIESSEWERVQGALQSAVELESKELAETRRLLVKISPMRTKAEVWDGQKWVRDHQEVKQLANVVEFTNTILWFRDKCKLPVCLLLDDMQGLLIDAPNKSVMALLRDFVRVKKDKNIPYYDRKTIVIASEGWKFPHEISHEMVRVEMPLPSIEVLKTTLQVACTKFDVTLPKGEMQDNIIKSALGLTVMEAEQAFATAIIEEGGQWTSTSSKSILKKKRDIIRQSGALDYLEADGNMDLIGGLDLLKEWLKERKSLFSAEAKQRGIDRPKGILLTGVPGCGKSLTAKAIGNEWGLPLVRFDIGSVFHKHQGASERNIRDALKLAEAVSPCVLFIDEIDKGLAGSGGSGNLDSGTGKRVFGTILTWMSDQTAGVFVVATANQLETIPTELKRKGRFDEIFYIDLPDNVSRQEIFKIHLDIKEPNWEQSDISLEVLAKRSEKWTGAEIEAAVNSALISAFNDGNRPILQEDIERFITATTPQAEGDAKHIEKMRKEADRIGRRASSSRDKNDDDGTGNVYN
jgi:ATP-dependent 26S proteasome regulatory subunit